MLEVMFVEKRLALVRTYRRMLSWQQYGFKIISITDNEQQAISYYGEYQHALIFVDLDLKKGNGFSLIKKLKALNRNCIIVVVSDREDFCSVHDAFRLGVYDYLLKKDIRVAVFADVLKQINEYYNIQVHYNWKNELEHLLGVYRDSGETDQQALFEIFKYPEFDLLKHPYQFVYFRMDNVRQINRNLKIYDQPDWISEEDYLHFYAERLKHREALKVQIEQVICDQLGRQSFILLPIKKHSGIIVIATQVIEKLRILVSNLQDGMIQKCHSDFSFTIGNTLQGIHEFLPELQIVMERHKDRFYIGDGCILSMQDSMVYQRLGNKADYYQRNIMEAVQDYDGKACLNFAHNVLQQCKLNHIYPEEVIQWFLNLFNKIEEQVKPHKYDFTLQKEAVFESETFAFLAFEIDRIFKTLSDEFQRHTKRHQEVIAQMLTYIKQHLADKVSVKQITRVCGKGLSPSYASKLIKRETGLSIKQFILEERMKLAVRLLKETDLKIKEVAKNVGFDDQLYFNKMFRKCFGLSPKAYRLHHM